MFAPVRALGRSAAKPGERHSTEREQADQSPRLARRRRSQLEEQPQDPLRRKALLAIDLAPMLNSDRSALGVKVGAKRLNTRKSARPGGGDGGAAVYDLRRRGRSNPSLACIT